MDFKKIFSKTAVILSQCYNPIHSIITYYTLIIHLYLWILKMEKILYFVTGLLSDMSVFRIPNLVLSWKDTNKRDTGNSVTWIKKMGITLFHSILIHPTNSTIHQTNIPQCSVTELYMCTRMHISFTKWCIDCRKWGCCIDCFTLLPSQHLADVSWISEAIRDVEQTRLLHCWICATAPRWQGSWGQHWGPPGSCRPQSGPMLAPWTLLSGKSIALMSLFISLLLLLK